MSQASQANRSSSSLITSAVTFLSDPPSKFVDSHLLDFLSAEILRQITASESVSRARRVAHEALVESDFPTSPLVQKTPRLSMNEGKDGPEQLAKQEEEAEEGVRSRLDGMGFKVGWALAERLARDRARFPSTPAPGAPSTASPSSTPAPPPPDALEAVKFICKDVWMSLFSKQVDNLRTNHRGVYVLVDNAFRPLRHMSTGGRGAEELEEARRMVRLVLAFPSGVIRGALATVGITCTVSADAAALPQCTFQIKTTKPGGP